jgi:hypothetical protein
MELIWVTSAEHVNDFKIRVSFNDGSVKTVNLEKHLDKPVFHPLKDKTFFKKFRLNPFTIEWENGADFSPEFLYRIGQDEEEKRNLNKLT